jgi:hypothetical protein
MIIPLLTLIMSKLPYCVLCVLDDQQSILPSTLVSKHVG